jgi:citrate/tricarballylate utilization protein
MPSTELLEAARRVMIFCNACRYCEGFCAVFPAMERRRTFSDGDLAYLSNLCHDCRGCYYACPYAPPHAYDVNVPRSLAELRGATYRDHAWPHFLSGLFRRNGLTMAMVSVLSVVVVLVLTFLLQDPATVLASHGEGRFFAVIAQWPMVLTASLVALFGVVALFMGFIGFWRGVGGHLGELADPRALARAVWHVLTLRYLAGGGDGCNYPEERFSHARRWFHQSVLYGFLLCFASTVVAAVYDHFLGRPVPFPYLSWPVVLGTLGGVALVAGTAGLLWLKSRRDPEPSAAPLMGMDVGFLVLLLATGLTGLLLLALRETAAMGVLLAVHLGVVLALFLTLPYGKFVHAIYRFAALVRFALGK